MPALGCDEGTVSRLLGGPGWRPPRGSALQVPRARGTWVASVSPCWEVGSPGPLSLWARCGAQRAAAQGRAPASPWPRQAHALWPQ